MRQLARASALVTLCSLVLRGSLRILGWTAEVSFVELALAIFFLAPIANAPLGLFYLLRTVTKAVATGLTLRIRRMYLMALEDRAALPAIERDQRVRLTTAAERSRVAHASKLAWQDAGLYRDAVPPRGHDQLRAAPQRPRSPAPLRSLSPGCTGR